MAGLAETSVVAVFVDRAQQFCELVEKAGDYSLDERLAKARSCLLRLYNAALELPLVELTNDRDAEEDIIVPSMDFGKHDFYYVMFDPYVEGEAAGGSLADDFSDIYRDLKGGLLLWASEDTKPNAIWDWRFLFHAHWGRHAIHALGALHHVCDPFR